MSLLIVITVLSAAVVGYTMRAARNSRQLDERLAARYASRQRARAEHGLPDGVQHDAAFLADVADERAGSIYEPAGPRYTPDTIAVARRAVRPSFGIRITVKP